MKHLLSLTIVGTLSFLSLIACNGPSTPSEPPITMVEYAAIVCGGIELPESEHLTLGEVKAFIREVLNRLESIEHPPLVVHDFHASTISSYQVSLAVMADFDDAALAEDEFERLFERLAGDGRFLRMREQVDEHLGALDPDTVRVLSIAGCF